MATCSVEIGQVAHAVARRLDSWRAEDVVRRIWSRDHTVWSPEHVPELTDRLGWLDLPERMPAQLGEYVAFADEIRRDGIRHVVLLGMGGSSLAPEVFQGVFGPRDGYPILSVLDSTHPAAVRAVERRIEIARTLFIVSSKSGGTSETTSFFKYFWHRCPPDTAGPQFVAITDPETSLDRLAHERGFRRVFHAPPDVGGRYSALTAFGLVPASLIGVDVDTLVARAASLAAACGPSVDAAVNPAVALGVALGELASAGRDKLTFLVAPPLDRLPAWLEQLIAESTGKHGQGIVPVAEEPVLEPASYGADRVFISLALSGTGATGLDAVTSTLSAMGHPVIRCVLDDRLDLGQQYFFWEMATAAAGAVLGIQPFDQPDVQLAKDLARRAMAAREAGASGPEDVPVVSDPAGWSAALARLMMTAGDGDYLGIQAFLEPSPEHAAALHVLREHLAQRTHLATTVGFGPRFLHSTGQLHKGGAGSGVFLQLTDEPGDDLAVPESSYTFGELIRAQAAGDAMALRQRERRLVRIGLGRDAAAGLQALRRELERG